MAKQCSYSNCSYPVFSKGLCQTHWKQEYGKPIKAKPDAVPLKRTPIIKKAPKKTAAQIQKDNDVNVFFADQAIQVPWGCENCGKPLYAYTAHQKRFITAHILPKNNRQFPSVATHPLNRMFLGFGVFSDCNCHADYDNKDAAFRVTMPCYKLAIERLQHFKHLLVGEEIGRAEKYLNTTI